MHVRNLAELDLTDWGEFGGKAAHLGHAARLSCPVLRGVAVSTQLFQRFAEQGGLLGEVGSILDTMQPRTLAQFQAAAWAIRSAFQVRRLPSEVRAELVATWETVGAAKVSVRSSATNEDSAQRSFIGQHASTLNVDGPEALVAAALDSWNSLFSAKSLAYAQRFGVDLLAASMGLIIQPMIEAQARGVLLTVDPITGDPDRFILEIHQGAERGVFDLDPYGRKPGEHSYWSQLRYYGLLLDEHDLVYQAIEWVISDSELFFLRVRPATAVPHFLPAKELPSDVPQAFQLVAAQDMSRRGLCPLSHYVRSRIGLSNARTGRTVAASPSPARLQVLGYLYRAPAGADETPRVNPGRLGLLPQGLRATLTSARQDQQTQAQLATLSGQVTALKPPSFGDLSGRELADLAAIIQQHSDDVAAECVRITATIKAQLDLLTHMHRLWAHHEIDPTQLLPNATPLPSCRDVPDAILTLWQGDILTAPSPWAAAMPPLGQAATAWASPTPAGLNPWQRPLYHAVLARAHRLQGLLAQALTAMTQARSLEQQTIREAGRRLRAAGAAATEQDITLLEVRELDRWLRGELPDEQAMRQVLHRREAQRRAWRYSPPSKLITSSTAASADLENCDLVLKGRAVSAGMVAGRARVIRSLGETSSVLPNEVLICRQATFELSPLFGTVAALVTETGALLDSGSVLAREYGVPAVFSVADAIAQFHTGDELVVDAVRGLVGRRRATPSPRRDILDELDDLN